MKTINIAQIENGYIISGPNSNSEIRFEHDINAGMLSAIREKFNEPEQKETPTLYDMITKGMK